MHHSNYVVLEKIKPIEILRIFSLEKMKKKLSKKIIVQLSVLTLLVLLLG